MVAGAEAERGRSGLESELGACRRELMSARSEEEAHKTQLADGRAALDGARREILACHGALDEARRQQAALTSEAAARPRTWATPTPCTFPSVHC